MCGLAGYFVRESVPDYDILDTLFTWSEKRGTDGFGVMVGRKSECRIFKSTSQYSKCADEVFEFLDGRIKLGDLILAVSRAAPEQEPPTTRRNMQPIYPPDYGCVLVHNGSVSNMIHQELKDTLRDPEDFQWSSDIDSEAIIAAYIKHGRNIKATMEYISGGVAALMYDQRKDCLYVITDFKPIAHAAIRGYGYMLASDDGALREVIQKITGTDHDGVNIWENFYGHYLRGQRIKEIDLDSGFVNTIPYSPRFITQDWDSNYNPNGTRKATHGS